MAKRTKFVMNMDWARLASNMPREVAGDLFIAISKFQLGEECEIIDPIVKAVFEMIKPQMEEDISKWEQTVEKNKKAIGKRWEGDTSGIPADTNRIPDDTSGIPADTNRIPTDTKCIPNDTDNGFDNGFDIGSDNGFENESGKEKIKTIVEHLNAVAGVHFKPDTPKTVSLIRARLKEGFTVDDFKTVIDKKAAHWARDGDMQRYLRPETLFGTKFEGYLNEHERLSTREEVDSWV